MYCNSQPVSGNWDTEYQHEFDAIKKRLNFTDEQTETVMKDLLGFNESGKSESLTESGVYAAVYDYFELYVNDEFKYANVDDDKVFEYNDKFCDGKGKVYFVTISEGSDGDVDFYREEILQ